MLPELEKQLVTSVLTRFCDERIPPHVKDKVRLEFELRGNSVTVIERRPVWNDAEAEWTSSNICRFDLDPKNRTWTLKCRDRNGKWRPYDGLLPTKNFRDVLADDLRLAILKNARPVSLFVGPQLTSPHPTSGGSVQEEVRLCKLMLRRVS